MWLLSAGDPGTTRVVSDAAELIGKQLAAICNLLAPRRVIVIGAMAEAGDLILGPIRPPCSATSYPATARSWSWARWAPELGPRAIALALDESDWLPVTGTGPLRSSPNGRSPSIGPMIPVSQSSRLRGHAASSPCREAAWIGARTRWPPRCVRR